MNHVTGNKPSAWLHFKKGNREAFAVIYNENVNSLLRYGYKICSNEDVLKDAIQDLFIELWNARERLAEPDSVKLYLFKALRYKLMRHDKQAMKIISEDDNRINLYEVNAEIKIIEKEENDFYLIQLQQAFGKLSKRQQEAIQLRFYEDFSNEQIAELMQINYQSVTNLLHNALKRIKEQFVYHGAAIFHCLIIILLKIF